MIIEKGFKCPETKELDYTLDFCEAICFGTGCKHIENCRVYELNKKHGQDMIEVPNG